MRNNVYRLMNLSQNMLDTVKLDAGFDKPCYKDTDVVALAADITNVVSSHVARGNIHVSFSANAASFLMPADTDKIEKILLNLLSNAVKHSPPGGQVGVTLSVDSASLLIIVSDEGPGISEDRIKTIFSRFRPADALARSQEGCGIGLSLSKALAELMGGHICVESRAEHGSRFYVELPVPSTAEVHPFTLDDGLTLEQKVQIAFSDITLSGDNGSNLKTPPP
jgi:signal transduction histidine kinase